MSKCLYITESYVARFSGSRLMNRGFCDVLGRIFDKDNYDVMVLSSIDTEDKYPDNFTLLRTNRDVRSFIRGYSAELDLAAVDVIIKKISTENYDFVFISHNTLGRLTKRIKDAFPGIKICTYYPGILVYHHKYADHYDITGGGLKTKIKRFYKIQNEKISNQYTDAILLLNERDEKNLKKYYESVDISKVFFCPIFMKDRYSDTDGRDNPFVSSRYNILFIGTYFGPNVHGIKWFCSEVLPKLGEAVQLTVIGSEMSALKSEIDNFNVTFYDFIEDLNPYYIHADLVIEPIFYGDGMKTKTAEALMYGKTVVGTTEAFCGYDSGAGFICNTKEEFVDTVRRLMADDNPKYSKKYREIYLRDHSYEAAVRNIKKVLAYLRINCELEMRQ